VGIDETEQDKNEAVFGFGNLSNALRPSGQLRAAETAAVQALSISRENINSFQTGVSERLRSFVLATSGHNLSANTALRRALAIIQTEQAQQSKGVAYATLAQHQLWLYQPVAALPLANRAWELAHIQRHERDFIRVARLQGEAALGINDLATAADRLHHALNRARAVNYVEEELPALTALAELHRRREDYDTARDLLEQVWDAAEHGPYPLLHADARNPAQFVFDRGQLGGPAGLLAFVMAAAPIQRWRRRAAGAAPAAA